MAELPRYLGEIVLWPSGYSMSLGTRVGGNSIVTCCSGHKTPGDAKNHGLVRLIEIAVEVADRDMAAWVAKEVA